ncbi:MAG TPA: M20/M25/M40 family metallo-hydrolase, partial [Kofleriaceae bacterium]|nr:M20/M25/M40 family metallo-hydrolase [Kofleriaceae bacterium]
MRALWLVVAVGACGSATAPEPPPPDPLSATALMSHVATLVDPKLEGRDAASDGEKQAASYVTARLRAMGLAPTEQTVPYKTGSRNVYATIAGASGDAVVIGAHLDHLGRRDNAIYFGADDNASGVAVVLGVAQSLAARRAELHRSVIVVLFGAEEPGMIGSQYFVAHPPIPLANVPVMVNIDMIGRPLLDQLLYRSAMMFAGIDATKSVGLVGARHYPGLRTLADAAFVGSAVIAAEDLPDTIGDEVERQSRGRGDSVSFEDRGVPALFFGDGESADYHKPTDTIDKLTPAILEARARAIARVV